MTGSQATAAACSDGQKLSRSPLIGVQLEKESSVPLHCKPARTGGEELPSNKPAVKF